MTTAVAVSQVAKYKTTKEDAKHEERLNEAGLVCFSTHQVPLSTQVKHRINYKYIKGKHNNFIGQLT